MSYFFCQHGNSSLSHCHHLHCHPPEQTFDWKQRQTSFQEEFLLKFIGVELISIQFMWFSVNGNPRVLLKWTLVHPSLTPSISQHPFTKWTETMQTKCPKTHNIKCKWWDLNLNSQLLAISLCQLSRALH